MNFGLSSEQQQLRETVRAFVKAEMPYQPLLRPDYTLESAGFQQNWHKLRNLGWQAMLVPEECGGLGAPLNDIVILIGELARELSPVPFLGTVLGTLALVLAADEIHCADILREIGKGRHRLALCASDAPDAPLTIAARHIRDDEWRIDGLCKFVIDAQGADIFVVPAKLPEGKSALFIVEDCSDVATTALKWRDPSRLVSDVEFKDTNARLVCHELENSWENLHNHIAVMFAAENAAGIRRVLEQTVAYVSERKTFGKPVAINQAIKHAMADMLGMAETSEAVVHYAAQAVTTEQSDAGEMSAIAKAYTGEAFVEQSRCSIQYFGALGFCWEMPNHLFYKRALANAQFFGDSQWHRRRAMGLFLSRQ